MNAIIFPFLGLLYIDEEKSERETGRARRGGRNIFTVKFKILLIILNHILNKLQIIRT